MNKRIELMQAVAAAELAQAAVEATQRAVDAVKDAADLHRKAYHTKHIAASFREALSDLDLQLVGDNAYLYRCNFDVRFIKEKNDEC